MNEINILKRKIERERKARKQAEQILEEKAIELFNVNQQLKQINENLEKEIELKSKAYIEKEKQYKMLVDSASDIIYNINLDGNFTYVNKVGIETVGLNQEEIDGMYFGDLIPEEFRKDTENFYKDVINNMSEDSYYEYPIKIKSGKTLWLGQRANPMRDKDGNLYFSVIARDITEKKNVEFEIQKVKKELERSEIKYRSIIENMEFGLLEVDQDGIAIKAYPLFCEMVGYTEEEILGKNPEYFLMDESSRNMITLQNKDRTTGKAGVYEVIMKTKSGKDIFVMISGAPFFDIDGNITGSIGIHHDITPIKELQTELINAREVAEKAQQVQKQFLATMSHEIRTPLNAIIGMTHLLSDTELNYEQEDLVSVLISSTNILRALISDILDISKIDSGNIDVQKKPINIAKLFESFEKIFQVKKGNKNVELHMNIGDRLDSTVLGDELLISQVFINLLGNAVKFTHAGTINLNASIIEEDKDKMTVLFSVKDTGIGMAENQVNIIFDPFKQANREIQEEYGGTGLGLAITKRIINLMGGEISVISAIGEGSEFKFELTFSKSEKQTAITVKTLNNASEQFSFEHPILIVEDNAMNQRYLTKLFKKWGIMYDIANNGKEGLEMAEENTYSMILMDLQMPIMDGYEACRLIRSNRKKELWTIPIVALSASTLLSKKREVKQVGMNDFLSKPFTPNQLAIVLKMYSDDFKESKIKDNQVKEIKFIEDLDVSYLVSLYEDDFEYAREMFDIFLVNVPQELEILLEKMKNNHRKEVYKLAHKIKPTFTMVGLTEEGKLMEQIEESTLGDEDLYEKYKGQINNILENRIPIVKNQIKVLNS